eukprot:13518_1
MKTTITFAQRHCKLRVLIYKLNVAHLSHESVAWIHQIKNTTAHSRNSFIFKSYRLCVYQFQTLYQFQTHSHPLSKKTQYQHKDYIKDIISIGFEFCTFTVQVPNGTDGDCDVSAQYNTKYDLYAGIQRFAMHVMELMENTNVILLKCQHVMCIIQPEG